MRGSGQLERMKTFKHEMRGEQHKAIRRSRSKSKSYEQHRKVGGQAERNGWIVEEMRGEEEWWEHRVRTEMRDRLGQERKEGPLRKGE